jgi:hypothetical protein
MSGLKNTERNSKMRSNLKKWVCAVVVFFAILPSNFVLANESENVVRFKRVSTLQLDLYSQSGYEQRTQNIVNQSRMTTALFELPLNSRFYVGTAFETDTRSNRTQIYNDNYFAPLLGVSWADYDIGMGARVEELLSYRENSTAQNGWKPEARAVLYHYQFYSGNVLRPGSRTFLESYGELAYKSNFYRNGFLQYLGKAGVRQELSNHIFVDLYPELSIKRDREGLPYENLTELRAATRVLYQQQRLSTFLSVSFQTPIYAGEKEYQSPVSADLVVAAEL